MGKLLIDYDSKIPNLALMKVSSHFKRKGEQVYLQYKRGKKTLTNMPLGDYDEVWLSCVFTWKREKAKQAIEMYDSMGKRVIFGGTGFDWGRERFERITLPPEIEADIPDYDLYGDDRAIGFCERGCDRKCQFCDVWKKEGRFNTYIPMRYWVPDGFKKVLLLDNDVALSPNHDRILDEADERGVKLCITQGYDIRCMTPERAKRVAENKPWDLDFKRRRLYIAWDYLYNEGWVKRGIQMLLDAGWKANQIFCYMICGFNTTHYEDLYRFYRLLEMGAEPYVMRYNMRDDDPWLVEFTRYVDRGNVRFVDITEYKIFCHTCGKMIKDLDTLQRCRNAKHRLGEPKLLNLL